MKKPLSISEAIQKSKAAMTLIEDEQRNLIKKEDLTHWERFRIFLNRWWVFVLLILAITQVFQTVIAVLKFFK